MWKSANLAFSLCQMLTMGAVEALAHHASDDLKQRFLPKMVAGEWTGTMNLTEPQAGSDLSAVRTRAEPDGDHFRLFGSKIFITWGEHDVAENIVHLVLARLPGAPPGTRGISLFVAPKFMVNPDGSLGPRNDLVCASIEHKLGIHGSPTAVMSFGDKEGAIAYLVAVEPRKAISPPLSYKLLEAIEVVAAVAHDLAGLGHVAELLGQLEQTGFGSDDLLVLGHGGVLRCGQRHRL